MALVMLGQDYSGQEVRGRKDRRSVCCVMQSVCVIHVLCVFMLEGAWR